MYKIAVYVHRKDDIKTYTISHRKVFLMFNIASLICKLLNVIVMYSRYQNFAHL